MSAACPKCGFDVVDGKPCRVCGYVPAAPVLAEASASSPHAPVEPAPNRARPAGRRRSTQGPVVMLASAVVGLLAVVGVFILGDLRSAAAKDGTGGVQPAVASSPTTADDSAPSTAASSPAGPETGTGAGMSAPPARSPEPAATTSSSAVSSTVPATRTSVVLNSSDGSFDITARSDDPPTSSRAAYVAWMLSHTDEKEKYLVQKWTLAQSMISLHSVTHPRVLAAILRAPREYFCRDPRRAYEDAVLPIGYGQTISGPHMVARMTDYLDPQPDQKVLEIGTGSGYQSAVLSELSNHVYSIEIVEPLARETDGIYRAREARYPEYRNVSRRIADGYYGWPEQAPFDRIIVTCGIDHVPPELLHELAPEGIMVIPVGPPSGQTILRIVKHVAADGSVTLDREDIFHGKKRQIFVPFRSGQGGIHVSGDPKETK